MKYRLKILCLFCFQRCKSDSDFWSKWSLYWLGWSKTLCWYRSAAYRGKSRINDFVKPIKPDPYSNLLSTPSVLHTAGVQFHSWSVVAVGTWSFIRPSPRSIWCLTNENVRWPSQSWWLHEFTCERKQAALDACGTCSLLSGDITLIESESETV